MNRFLAPLTLLLSTPAGCRWGSSDQPFRSQDDLCAYLAVPETECADACVSVACPDYGLHDLSGQGACPESELVVYTSQRRLAQARSACESGWDQRTCVQYDDSGVPVADPAFHWVVYCSYSFETD